MSVSKYTVYTIVAVMIFAAGMATGVYWLAPALTTHHTTTIEKQPIVLQEQTITNTKVEYVPGERVYLSAEGKDETVATKLDGKFTIGKPKFIYEINGKYGQFTKADDEQFLFDKNMIQLTQASTITLKAEIPMIDRTKNGAIGIGYGNNGIAGKIDIKKLWFYADKDTKSGGVQYRF